MRAVDIGVGHDHDPLVAQVRRIAAIARAAAERLAQIAGGRTVAAGELMEANQNLLTVSHKAAVMEASIEVLEGKRKLLVRFRDRLDELCVEIEDVVFREIAVLECAVIGVPDDLYGEKVKAFIVVKEGYALEESVVLDLCKKNLAEYKVPSIVEFVDDLPKGPTGKILKRMLR